MSNISYPDPVHVGNQTKGTLPMIDWYKDCDFIGHMDRLALADSVLAIWLE